MAAVIATLIWALVPAVGEMARTALGVHAGVLLYLAYAGAWIITFVAWTIIQAVITMFLASFGVLAILSGKNLKEKK